MTSGGSGPAGSREAPGLRSLSVARDGRLRGWRREPLIAGPPIPPSADAMLVGRQRERWELEAALAAAIGGEGRVVLLTGDPGGGKSRMVQWLAREAAERKARVLVAHCVAGTPMPPYWPWLDIVCGGSGEASLRPLARELLGAGPVTSTVVDPASGGPPLDASSERGALFGRLEAFAAFVRGAAAREPLVVVLEDVHLTDTPSLLVLQWVAQQLATQSVLLAATYRDGEVSVEHPLADTLAELLRLPWMRRITLPPLTVPDVAAYVAQLAGTTSPDAAVRTIHAYTGGNPLFVAEVVQQLLREERFAPPADIGAAALVPPLAIRDAIRGRLRRLPAPCTEMLTTAAILEGPFSLARLAGVLEKPAEEVLALIEAAAMQRLVVQDAHRDPPAYRFAQPVVRAAVLEVVSLSERGRLARRVEETGRLAVSQDDETPGGVRGLEPEPAVFRSDGQYWTIEFGGTVTRLADSMGLRSLAHLLGNPGREFLALDLALLAHGHAGEQLPTETAEPVLDAGARGEYRRRLGDLREALAEAERFNDFARAARAQDEIDFLLRELAHGVGLGGRVRRTADPSERARINVTRTVKAAIQRLGEHDRRLGRHLAATVHTGFFCSYTPDPRLPIAWLA